MGMYDSFILKNKNCPKCNAKIDEFQSKDFDCVLEKFIEGESTFRKYTSRSFFINNGIYKVYTSCWKCHSWITAKIEVKNKKFKRIFDIKIGE